MSEEKEDRRGCGPGEGTVETETGGRIGNPPHEVTQEKRERVRLLAKIGSAESVAEAMGFSVKTLDRHYAEDYKAGRKEAVHGVKSKLLTQALGGSVNAMWKYLQLMGEVKRQPMVVTGPNGGPVQTVDLSRLSDKQLEDYGRLAAIAAGLDPDAIIVEHIEDGPPLPVDPA